MSHSFQVVIDCADPHGLADWWAETLGWVAEEQDETFIRSMLEQGHAVESETTEHRGRLVWLNAAIHPDTEKTPERQRILFQLVAEPKTIKNRLHLDIRPSGDIDLDDFRSRLESRGAIALHTGREGPHTWVTMADPEGNEFCV